MIYYEIINTDDKEKGEPSYDEQQPRCTLPSGGSGKIVVVFLMVGRVESIST